MRSNPMLNSRVTENLIPDSKPMTIQGTVNKSMILATIVIACGTYTRSLFSGGYGDKAALLTAVSFIAGLILMFIASFKPKTTPLTAPAYAVCEGLLLGSISWMYGSHYNGIVIQAIALTFLALFSMLFLYKLKIIQATPVFKKVIFTSTLAIGIFYLVCFVASLFGHPAAIFTGSPFWIGASVVFCAVAAFNFIMDFSFIDECERMGAPSYFEWYNGFGLLVTAIWLYLEILDLLAQLSRRN